MQGDFEMVGGDGGQVYRPGELTSEQSYRRVRRSFCENIAHALTNQDSQQRGTYTIILLIELYRCIIANILLVFTPQQCGDHTCSYSENMTIDDLPTLTQKRLYIAGLFFNYASMAAFLALYVVEVVREERLLRYLEVNPKVKGDSETCKKVIAMLPENELKELKDSQSAYFGLGITTGILFVTNTVISAIIISKFYAGSVTISTFVTNVLFMFTKVSTVITNTTAPEAVLYSACKCLLGFLLLFFYTHLTLMNPLFPKTDLTTQIQYNALDPDEAEHDKMVNMFQDSMRQSQKVQN